MLKSLTIWDRYSIFENIYTTHVIKINCIIIFVAFDILQKDAKDKRVEHKYKVDEHDYLPAKIILNSKQGADWKKSLKVTQSITPIPICVNYFIFPLFIVKFIKKCFSFAGGA